MKKSFRTAALAALTFTALTASAQVVTRSRQVPGFRPYDVDLAVMSKAEKDSVLMVADLWKMYVESFTTSSVSEDRRRSMWMDGAPDYLLELDDGSMLYSAEAAKKVWEYFGIGDRMGWSIVGQHGHCRLPETQYPEVQAFIDRFLLGRDVKTDNIKRVEDLK